MRLCRLLCTVLFIGGLVPLLLVPPALATNITWKTGTSGTWNVSTNWLPNQVPGAGDVAIIAAAGTYDINLNGNVTVNAINLGSTGSPRLHVNGVTLTASTGISVGASSVLEVNAGTVAGGGISLNGQLSSTGTSNINCALTTVTSSTVAVGVGSLTVANGFTNRGLLSYYTAGVCDLYVTSGTFTNAATGTIASTSNARLYAALDNQGSISVSGTSSGLIVQKSGVTHASSGSITISGTGCVITFSLSGSTLNTSGNIMVGSGCGMNVLDGVFHQTAGSMTGAGIFQLALTTAATFASNPTIANLYLGGGGMEFPSALVNGAAQALMLGPGCDLTVPQLTNQAGYTLQALGPADLNLTMFTNLGTFIAAEDLVVDGNMNMGPAASLNFDLGGVLPAAQYDRMTVTGAVTLGGTLNLTLVNGFVPAPGDSFDLITHSARFASFGQINGVDLGSDLYLITDPRVTGSANHPYTMRAVHQKWTALTASGTPPAPRRGHSAVYAPSSDRLVVFGGETAGGGVLGDVWVLTHASGSGGTPTWSQLAPTGTPPAPRKLHSAVYDPINNRMIVFGGENDSAAYFSDIWVLTDADGSAGTPAWSPFPSLPGVAPRSGHAVGYNPISNRMVMSQGAFDCNANLGDMWVLDHANGLGTTTGWTSWSIPGTPPSPRRDAAVAYDPVGNRLLIYGGRTPCGAVETDAFVLSDADGAPNVGPGWSPLGTGASPAFPGGSGAPGVYDPYRDRFFVFGGLESDGTTRSSAVFLLTDTHGSETGWARLPLPGTRPSARAFHSMVYSPSTRRAIVFGGQAEGEWLNDLWVLELDGDAAPVTAVEPATPGDRPGRIAFSALPSPNPSSRGMQFTVHASAATQAEVVIYDALGRRVTALFDGPMASGDHRFSWNGEVASGIYFVAVRSGDSQDVRRIVVAR